MSRDIYVVAEQRQGKIVRAAYELTSKAAELAKTLQQRVIAVVLGNNIKGEAENLIFYGADEVLYVDDPFLREYMTEPYTKAVSAVIRAREPEIVLFSATCIGRDLAPRVSARMHTGLTADCTELEIDKKSGLLIMTRPAFGGNIMASIVCEKARPQMATVRPGVMDIGTEDKSKQGKISQFHVDFGAEDAVVRIVETLKDVQKKIDITQADILISGGRGMGSGEKFGRLYRLAELMGGEVSASRAAVEAGWADKEQQVGQTGKTVRPKLYFAFGISGAVQHMAGMENSDLIIAVNKDEKAPIFSVAHVCIVGDIHQILQQLIKKLETLKQDRI